MPFVKDTSYRDMPFSSETPNDDFHSFLTVTELTEKISKDRNRLFRCRTVGTVTCYFGQHVLHEIDDNSMQIRVSLAYTKRRPPFTGKPYPAQLFGFVQWRSGEGPVIYPHLLQSIPAFIAIRLRDTMKWVIDTHFAFAEDNKKDE